MEIQKELKEWLDENGSELMNDWGEFNEDTFPKGWKREFIKEYGGEDMGSEYWGIHKFINESTKEEFLVKFDGWYQSFHGSEFNSWFVVVPKEETITVYEAEA